MLKLQRRVTTVGYYCLVVVACLVIGSVSAVKITGDPVTSSSQQLRVDNYRYDPLATSENNNQIVDDNKNDQEVVPTSQMQDIQGEKTTTVATTTTVGPRVTSPVKHLQNRLWGRLDTMDKMIVSSTLPLAALTSVIPLMQAADLFWVNQLGDTIAVSAQSAANMVYQFSFGMFSFLPAVTATLVSKNYANNDLERTQAVVCRAIVFATMFASTISMILFTNTGRCLGAVLKEGNPALILSTKYLRIRCLSLIPQMVSYVCFSAFRGMMDYKPCLKISFICNSLNVIITPLLIHVFKFGVVGSAISALFCDSLTAVIYMRLMIKKKIFVWQKAIQIPTWDEISPLVKGSTLQARSFAMHFTNLMVARKIQGLDDTGVAPAAFALAMQTFFTGGVIIFALGMATQTLYPTAVAKCSDDERGVYVKTLIKRLLGRGFYLGTTITVIQALLIPFILRTTPLAEVRQAALFPIIAVLAYQGINGIVCVGEGIMVGDGRFASASIILIIASLGYMGCLQVPNLDINGVFISLGVFTLLRLGGLLAFLPSSIRSNSTDRTLTPKKVI